MEKQPRPLPESPEAKPPKREIGFGAIHERRSKETIDVPSAGEETSGSSEADVSVLVPEPQVGPGETARLSDTTLIESRPKPEIAPSVRWKPYLEQPPSNAEEEGNLAERRAWLMKALADQGTFKEPGTQRELYKRKIIQAAEAGLHLKDSSDQAASLTTRRFGKAEDRQRAQALLHEYETRSFSLKNLLDRADTPDQVKALKIFSAALLDQHLSQQGQKPWQEMSEGEKRLARLGEIVGLEAERRQIEMAIKNERRMDQGVVQRAYERYATYVKNPDLPFIYREKFERTMRGLASAYKVNPLPAKQSRVERSQAATSRRSTEQQPAQQPVPFLAEASADALYKGSPEFLAEATTGEMALALHSLREKQKSVFENDPDVRQEIQDIYEDNVNYDDKVLNQLKSVYQSTTRKDDMYRQRFIENMPFQMNFAAYQNSEASLWSRAIRGVIDGMESRRQVFGWTGVFSFAKMRQIRGEVAKSWAALAQSKDYPARDSALAHVQELAMANLNDTKNRRGLFKRVAGWFKGESAYNQEEHVAEFDKTIANYYPDRPANPDYRISPTEFDKMVTGAYQEQNTKQSQAERGANSEEWFNKTIEAYYKQEPSAVSSEGGDSEEREVYNEIKQWRMRNPRALLSDLAVQDEKLFKRFQLDAKKRKTAPEVYLEFVQKDIDRYKNSSSK